MAEEKTLQQQVDEFIALPHEERRATYFDLPVEVRRKARKILEARRGIAYRTEGGDMVLNEMRFGFKLQVHLVKIELAGR